VITWVYNTWNNLLSVNGVGIMVLLLYLWENVKKWSSFDEGDMREPYSSYYGGGGEESMMMSPHEGGVAGGTSGVAAGSAPTGHSSILGKPYTTDQGYQQVCWRKLRRKLIV